MFEPNIKNLTIADGQLAATATQIVAGPGNHARQINVVLSNTGTQDETIVLTYSRNGGTQRRVWRCVLSANWQARVCGLPINVADVLYGSASDASVVDYLVSISGPNAPLTMAIYDDNGYEVATPQILDQLVAATG